DHLCLPALEIGTSKRPDLRLLLRALGLAFQSQNQHDLSSRRAPVMTSPWTAGSAFLSSLAIGICLLNPAGSSAADHNDPNSINSIYSDIPVNAADLYDLFGFPSDDTAGGEKVVVALTFASIPKTGVFDTDMLYRIRFAPNPRVGPPLPGGA